MSEPYYGEYFYISDINEIKRMELRKNDILLRLESSGLTTIKDIPQEMLYTEYQKLTLALKKHQASKIRNLHFSDLNMNDTL